MNYLKNKFYTDILFLFFCIEKDNFKDTKMNIESNTSEPIPQRMER